MSTYLNNPYFYDEERYFVSNTSQINTHETKQNQLISSNTTINVAQEKKIVELDTKVVQLQTQIDNLNAALENFSGLTEITNIINRLDILEKTVLDNELTITSALTKLRESCGFDENSHYQPSEDSIYIKDAKSLSEAINILDTQLQDYNNILSERIQIDENGKMTFIADDVRLSKSSNIPLYPSNSDHEQIYLNNSMTYTNVIEKVANAIHDLNDISDGEEFNTQF